MSFRVTRNSDGSITTESDDGHNLTHATAQQHGHQIEYMMEKADMSSVEGRDYNSIANQIAEAHVKKYGGDIALERAEIGRKMVW